MDVKHNIFVYNLLKSNHVTFDQDMSFNITRILDLSNQYALGNLSIEDTAHKLLRIFELGSSEHWTLVDRVCFVYRDSYSNQVRLLSSNQTSRVKSNILVPGYSCMVSESSSLMSLKGGEIRILDNIQDVLAIYRQNHHPVQRTVALLEHSGLTSGLTLPLVSNNFQAGFLFLNSVRPGVFNKLSDQDYALLCLLQLTFQGILHDYSAKHMNTELLNFNRNIENKNKISLESLKTEMIKISNHFFNHELEFEITTNVDLNFLLPQRRLVYALATALMVIRKMKQKVCINFNTHNNYWLEVEITVDDRKVMPNAVDFLSLSMIKDLKVEVLKDSVKFLIKTDYTDGKFDYSTLTNEQED